VGGGHGEGRRRPEVGEAPTGGAAMSARGREGEGEAGRRWLLGRKSKLGSRPALVRRGKNKRGGERRWAAGCKGRTWAGLG
jgi:hypothetical protein